MPVERGKDSIGYFYRYGKSGSKYHYNPGCKAMREDAKRLAHLQGRAIEFGRHQK